MEPEYLEALRYLSVPAGSFWKWDEQGAIVVWSSGSTLAFREELAIMLERLAEDGLPVLDSVLLLIAATRLYWPEDSLPLQHRLRTREAEDLGQDSTNSFCSTLFERLQVIFELPDQLLRSTSKKADLAAIVFERAPRSTNSSVARVVVDILNKQLNGSLPNLSKLRGGRVQTRQSLIHSLFPLCHGLQGVSEESLQLRSKTGLDTVPEPISVDYSVEQPVVRGLLQDLARDSELAGLSRLARNLAAVVQLPRLVSESNELPLGGVSDLTNRGPLDRLLLSELAHDDLMLATRVALNEALYLRREVPPGDPPKHCYVLVDSGIRMWGVPRVYAIAAVLSLAATGERDTSMRAYRASGSGIVSIDLSTRGGLIEHLGVLEPAAHPGAALDEFFERQDQRESPGDVVIVTTETVLKDANFQRHLAAAIQYPLYVVTVNRDGDLQLWSYRAYGRKCHSTLHLDLNTILNPEKSESSNLIDESADPHLPAIFRAFPFPFRLAYHFRDFAKEIVWSVPLQRYHEVTGFLTNESDKERTRHLENRSESLQLRGLRKPNPVNGVMVILRERQLLFFDDTERGARLMTDYLPFGRCLHAWPSEDELTMYALIHREAEQAIYLVTVSLVDDIVRSQRLQSKYSASTGTRLRILGATSHGTAVFLICSSYIEAFAVSTGEFLDAIRCNEIVNWHRSRYLWSPLSNQVAGWYALSYDAKGIQFQRVPLGKFSDLGADLVLFDRRGHDGAFAVALRKRSLIDLSNEVETPIPGSWQSMSVADIDTSGRRIMFGFQSNRERKARVFHLTTGILTEESNETTFAKLDARKFEGTQPPMRRFTRVVVENEQLTLVSRGHVRWYFSAENNVLHLVQLSYSKSSRLSRNFEPVKNTSAGVTLHMAQWADGSRAWIDARGMLHLQSSDPQIPEVSLLLNPSNVAVWTSDGRRSGLNYFVDSNEASIKPADVVDDILVPFVSRLK